MSTDASQFEAAPGCAASIHYQRPSDPRDAFDGSLRIAINGDVWIAGDPVSIRTLRDACDRALSTAEGVGISDLGPSVRDYDLGCATGMLARVHVISLVPRNLHPVLQDLYDAHAELRRLRDQIASETADSLRGPSAEVVAPAPRRTLPRGVLPE